jgi:site-specific recombinase
MEQALDFNLILGTVFGILGLVLIVLWIAMSFAVFRIKQRLDETNRHLEAIVEQLKALIAARATPSLDETNKHLKVIVERLKSQTEATLKRKKPIKTSAGGRVSQLYRGKVEKENDEDE